jgi:hypothetical protein
MNALVGRSADGKPFLMLVLEPGNLQRLKEGRPIEKHIEDLFPDGIPRRLDLVISFSETPIADARGLAASAEVVLDERTPRSKQVRPHCPECKSTIEQLGGLINPGMPLVVFCVACGCALGVTVSDGMKAEAEESSDSPTM